MPRSSTFFPSVTRSSRLRAILFVLGTALLLYMAAAALVFVGSRFQATSTSVLALLGAAAAYLISHLLRIMRLALVTGDARVSLRLLASIHIFTSGVGLAIPFKLGDAYRAYELSAAVGGLIKAVTIVFIERLLDVALILFLLLIAVNFGIASSANYGPVLVASAAFVSIAIMIMSFMPDNLRRLAGYIIRRYDGEWTVDVLRRIAEARVVIRNASAMFSGRYAALILLTMLIWAFELLSLTIVLVGAMSAFEPLATLLTFLSGITEGGTLLSFLASSEESRWAPAALGYALGTQVTLVLVALLAAIRLMRPRLFGRSAANGQAA